MPFKVNLQPQGPNGLRNGYINIGQGNFNVENLPENTTFVPGFFTGLDQVLENDSTEEMIFNMPLNILVPQDIKNIIEHWKTKLINGGILKVFFVDVESVVSAYDKISIDQLHSVIYGNGYQFKSLINLHIFKKLIEALGFKIQSISRDNVFASVELVK